MIFSQERMYFEGNLVEESTRLALHVVNDFTAVKLVFIVRETVLFLPSHRYPVVYILI